MYRTNLLLRKRGESTEVVKSTTNTAWLAEANLTANKEELTSTNLNLASLKHDVTRTYQAWIEAGLNGGDVDKIKQWYANVVLNQKEHIECQEYLWKVSGGIKNAEATANAEVAAKLTLTEVWQECTTANKDVSDALRGWIQARSNSGKAEKPEELFDVHTCPNSTDNMPLTPPPTTPQQARQPMAHEEILIVLDKQKGMPNR